jgi:PRTRC genetic system ThiF family protein
MNRKTSIAPRISDIVVVGIGGTGSYFAQGLAKLVAGYQLQVNVVLVDPDTIEEKNCSRQNFHHCEIGQNKAQALAYRLNQQYGLAFAAAAEKGELFVKQPLKGYRACSSADFLDGNNSSDYSRLIVTCVDSVASRKHYRNLGPWLDLGNGETTGQALYGTAHDAKQLARDIENWDKTPTVGHLPNAWLAFNLEQHKEPKRKAPGCADQPFAEQGIFANEWAAAAGLAILHQLLIKGELTTPAIYFDTRGRMSPEYITREYLGGK